ncbi:hypothetical protein MCOR25_000216 [Pyricularia grisea]|uniref:O-methyltransferase C-terminal domain-containing protein n=1 Tax=Pyricularia grisea TaxID=148305 RepID=A0A6P8BJE6_PYRGI|nr:uncharacterized protein PgNI_02295 [Pyricularia grisea]KAI6383296.1 hypothetical protein MCOR25_000216 [Pyricularia grisea]TLD17021.1 hypothetical protein PgNI_02295 [Pyricularia grisea]
MAALESLSQSADALDDLAAKLRGQARELRAAVKTGDQAAVRRRRYEALDAAQEIVSLLKDPSEQWADTLQSASLAAVVRQFQEWKVFDAIPTAPGASISYEELAGKTGVQMQLLRRMAWMTVSVGLLRQESGDRISHTPRSLNYLEGTHGADFHKTLYSLAIKAFASLSEYFAKYGPHEPQEQNHIPATFAVGSPELTFWGHLERHPDMIAAFMHSIAPAAARMPITGIYDFGWVAEEAKRDTGGDRVLINDVGGGTGHCIVAIQAENPAIPKERFMLQDQYHIIDQLKRDTPESVRGFKLAGLDFNKESPVEGALIYYLRRILHDYSDKLAVNILRNTVAVMAPDSRILIAEDLSTNPPHPITAMMDMLMLTCGGKERTMEDFEAVIKEAGLRVSSVSRSAESPMAVIECVKA